MHHVIDGLSSQQQQELTARIHELLETKKKSLLEQHKHLMDVDFVKLGSGTTILRQVWVANMEMAISVAKVALYPRTLPIIAHAVAQELLPSGEQGSSSPHTLQAYRAYYTKATKNHDPMSPSSLCSSIQVSLLLLTYSSTSFLPIKTTISSSRAYPSTP